MSWKEGLVGVKTLVMMAAVVAFVGCSNPFAPEESPPNPPKKRIKPPDSPENVLHNLDWAMNNKDSEEYEKCLDEDYMYHSPPPFEDEPPLDWYKDEEVRIIKRMFGQDPTYAYPEEGPFETIEFDFIHGDPWIETGKEAPEEHPDEDWVVFSGPIKVYLRHSEGYGYDVHQRVEIKLRQVEKGHWAIIRWIDYEQLI